MFFPHLELKGGNKNSPLLRGRFIMPPFSVFDARQGYWQDRKRAWIALGIKSEIGRGENLLSRSESEELYMKSHQKYQNRLSPGGSPRPACNYKSGQRGDGSGKPLEDKKVLKGLTFQSTGWSAEIFENRGGGTSIFDPVLCECIYRWFVPAGGTVLDPFAGGSVRGIVANFLGLHYTGIELSEQQIEANRIQAKKIVANNQPEWINGDSNTMDKLLPADKEYDFVFSCPPYHDLEIYSENPDDLSNMPYKKFVEIYSSIIKKAVGYLKNDRFACFVVGEIRDKKTGFYKNFVLDTIDAFYRAGAEFYNDAVLITAVGSLPVRTNNYFKSRKLGKTHQNVLVFYKGDPDKIKENFTEVI